MSITRYTPKNYPEGNWAVSDGPVIPYLSIKEATPMNKVIMRVMGIGGGAKWKDETINCFKILARLKHTDVPYFKFFLSLYRGKGDIKQTEREKIICRAAWRLGCIYEYSNHRIFLKKKKVPQADIDAITVEDSDRWSDRDRALYTCVDELINNHFLPEEKIDELRVFYTDDQVVQFLMLVGHYIMVACVVNSSGCEVEDHVKIKGTHF